MWVSEVGGGGGNLGGLGPESPENEEKEDEGITPSKHVERGRRGEERGEGERGGKCSKSWRSCLGYKVLRTPRRCSALLGESGISLRDLEQFVEPEYSCCSESFSRSAAGERLHDEHITLPRPRNHIAAVLF